MKKRTIPFYHFPKILALSSLTFYLAWNVYWLGKGRIPPSILLGVFGIPAPTTGMTRSWVAALQGQPMQSILWSPFTLPVTLLFTCSLPVFLHNIFFRRGTCLHTCVVNAWIIMLGASWTVKLLLGPTWW